MGSNGNGSDSPQNSKYYDAGCTELATETPLTLQRLETRRILTKTSTRLVIVLVGLPARGKSFVARKMDHFLNWSGVRCKIFNVGKYRREAYAALQESNAQKERSRSTSIQKGACDADFFDAKNEFAAALRERVAEIAMADMLRWLDEDEEEDDESNHGTTSSNLEASTHSSVISFRPKLNFRSNEKIAIFDATNSTDKRRRWVLEECTSPTKRAGKTTGVVFVESICDDKELLMENYRFKVSNSPDYEGMSYEESIADLMKRVQKYEEQYETITDDSLSYIKVFNLSTKLLVNHIYGRMAKDLVPALMAWHIGSRPIFLVRPGQTVSGVSTDGEDYVQQNSVDPKDPRFLDLSRQARKKAMRGDTLGPKGMKFRDDLLDFMYDEVQNFLLKRASVQDMAYTGTSISGLASTLYSYGTQEADVMAPATQESGSLPLRVLTSTMPRALDTVVWDESHNINAHQISNLNPLDKGDYVGMELEEIRDLNPGWYEKLEADPYNTRFPGGECYRDLVKRLTSVVVDLEQQVSPVLVVSHVSILQCLMAYFRNTPIENCMSIEVPMHTVIKFEPVRGGGFRETQHSLEDAGSVSSILIRQESDAPSFSCGSRMSTKALPIWGDHMTTAEDT